MNLPEISGRAGIAELVETMKQPAYLKLLGKCLGTGLGAGLITRRLPAFAGPIALVAGIYVGLEMAAYMEEEAKRKAAVPVIDATAVPLRGTPGKAYTMQPGGEPVEVPGGTLIKATTEETQS